jgi:hypothetical protein
MMACENTNRGNDIILWFDDMNQPATGHWMIMILIQEFQGDGYFTFKQDVERNIGTLEAGEYTIELNEVNDPLEIIKKVSQNDPEEYLGQCRFFRFFSEIYKLPYVEKLLKFAQEHGYSLVGPNELKDEYSMEHFVKDALAKKQKGAFNIDSCFELLFVKKTHEGQHSLADIRSIRLLEYKNSRYAVRKLSNLIAEIQKLER